MHENSSPLAGRLRRCEFCTKAEGASGIGSWLLLGLLLAEYSRGLAERCTAQVKSDKEHAMREMTHLRSDQIHPPDQRPIRQTDPVADRPQLSRT